MSVADGLGALARVRRGRVFAFDFGRGLGTVREDESGAEHEFHCTAITDGSRNIEPGTSVDFELRAAALGRIEATKIVVLA